MSWRFFSIAIQRDAPRGLIPSPKATLLSFYFRPFVISTTMVLEDGGSGVARMTTSKWQPRLSYIRFGLTGDPGRVVVFLSFSSISLSLSLPLCVLSLFLSSLLSSFYTSSFSLFFAKLFATATYRVRFHRKRYFRCQDFSLLSRQATRVVAQIVVIRNNVIMFARTLGTGIISAIASYLNKTDVYHFLVVCFRYFDNDFQ